MRIRRMRLKVCFVGDRGVGKTSLIQRYVEGKFDPDEKGTLGAHMYPVEAEVPLENKELVKVKVAFFDFMGEHALRARRWQGKRGICKTCSSSERSSRRQQGSPGHEYFEHRIRNTNRRSGR